MIMDNSENLLEGFQQSAGKQITRMQESIISPQQVHDRTPTHKGSKKEAPIEEIDMFDYVPVRYEQLKERLEFVLIKSGNLKSSMNASGINHHIYKSVRKFLIDLNDKIDSPKNYRHVRLVEVAENEIIKEHFVDGKFATTIKSILHKLIPLANCKHYLHE